MEAGAMDWGVIDDSPAAIRELLERRGVALKKRWGQNFMVSRAARQRLVAALDPRSGESVWEIGPGLGGLTALLCERDLEVTVFEIDHGLLAVLEERFGDTITRVPGDAVRTFGSQARRPGAVVGNLPYRSAAAIVTTLVEGREPIAAGVRRMVFTVQKEMAARMVARPGGKDYSAFSVICGLTCRVSHAGDLGKGNFSPPPGVVSSVVVMEPLAYDPAEVWNATRAARALFTSRRKTIANNAGNLAAATGMSADAVMAALERAGIDPTLRAEVLDPQTFAALGRELCVPPTPA